VDNLLTCHRRKNGTKENEKLITVATKKYDMKILLCLCLILSSGTMLIAQDSKKINKSQIANIITESFDQIWSDLNSKNIEKFYTKDFLLLENGEVWNNDFIANYLDHAIIQKPIPKRVNTIEIIKIKITDKTAWIAYKNAAIFSIDNKIVRRASWLESASAILTAEGWKLDMLHSTRTKNEIIKVDSTRLKTH